MTDDVARQRKFFAEEVEAVCNLRTPNLVDAFATVPRERFLRPGPWLVSGAADVGGGPRATPDANPGRVYHNVSIAIDAARQLFSGSPGVVGQYIEALGLHPGDHVLHVGCGLGYYSALMAHCVGAAGRVVAVEIDETLASEARTNLAAYGWVNVRCGDGVDLGGESFDAILVHAGMTHPHETWLGGLTPGGRLVVPLTCTMPQMGSTLGKGFVVLISDSGRPDALDARVLSIVAIYSAVGLRDEAMNARLGRALSRSPWPMVARLRRDPHDESPACWLHGDTSCLSA